MSKVYKSKAADIARVNLILFSPWLCNIDYEFPSLFTSLIILKKHKKILNCLLHAIEKWTSTQFSFSALQALFLELTCISPRLRYSKSREQTYKTLTLIFLVLLAFLRWSVGFNHHLTDGLKLLRFLLIFVAFENCFFRCIEIVQVKVVIWYILTGTSQL